jgi:hypothetical protein
MKRYRFALLLFLLLSMLLVVAPAAAATETSTEPTTKQVTFVVHDRGGNHIATAVTDETFIGNWAFGTWRTTAIVAGGEAFGSLIAYHFRNGIIAQITEEAPIAGRGRAIFFGGFGSLSYRMETGDRGTVAFVASSPEPDVWHVRLLGPTPPLFFTD